MHGKTTIRAVLLAAALPLVGTRADAGDEVQRREPGPQARGKVYEWTSKDAVAYQYRVPERYDPEKGASLTFVLHGSNLDRRWGFANHPADEFRPDDVVVCPDGTTPPTGKLGFNFMNDANDVKRLHALHEELKAAFPVRATYLYGHSQGSFFAFEYAGEHPEDVQGVVGHASGVWGGTATPKKAHAQAIVLLHGTADPVVAYRQSAGGYVGFREAGYPMVRLRSLQGWNHWPAEVNGSIGGSVVPHTSQQIAWCEGMTSADAERVSAAFDFLADVRSEDWHDYAALHSLAARVEGLEFMDAARRKRAAAAREAVEGLARAHVAALEKATAKTDAKTFSKGPWSTHLGIFLRDFAGVPACEELRAKWRDAFAAHERAAEKALGRWYQQRERKPAEACEAGVQAIREGFLHVGCADPEFLNALEGVRKDAAKHKIAKGVQKEFDELVPAYRKSIADGQDAFMDTNRKLAKF